MISVKQLSKKYGNRQILDNISFEIPQGEIYGLVGPNGVGKTTLLSLLMNLIKPDSGVVYMAGLSSKQPDYLKRVGFMQDNTVLYPHLTGYEHLAYIAHLQKVPEETIENISQKVGNFSYLHQKVGEYSLGMKQHLLFACAIIHQPKIILLDEPFNGLDPTSLIRIRELIMELSRQGTTIFLSSHNLVEIDRMTHQILFLKDGHILPYDLSQHRRKSYVISFNQDVEPGQLPFDYEMLNSDKLLVKEASFASALAHFTPQGLIADIESSLTGSEDLYREIFLVGE